MRTLPALLLLLLCGCGPGLVFHSPGEMTPEQMLRRADLVFVGVIEGQSLESWPFFRMNIPGATPEQRKYWRVLRRRVRVETVLRGTEPRERIDVHEIFWVGGAVGNWNFTRTGDRDLFLVRSEGGKYHVVRDWLRSIFPVPGGPREKLPLDESHPFWERVALMNYRMTPDVGTEQVTSTYFTNNHDPGSALSQWRTLKLMRGLVRHPSAAIRVAACRRLLITGYGQDECWESLTEADRAQLSGRDAFCCAAESVVKRRRASERDAESWWINGGRESRRLLTAMSNRRLRAEFCRRWAREYPGDNDNGCPADAPPPATIVTERGDVPLTGAWPKS